MNPDRSHPDSDKLVYGHWVVAFLDLLGQKAAFRAADFIPDEQDEEGYKRLTLALRQSVGAILTLRQMLTRFDLGREREESEFDHLVGATPAQRAFVRRASAHRVLELRWSDGVVLAAPLTSSPGHNPVSATWQILHAVASTALVQLAKGRPIRAGVDAGRCIEVDGELFGAGVVQAYELESETAQWPRVVVGSKLVDFLGGTAAAPSSDVIEKSRQALAKDLLARIVEAEDGLPMLHFGGPEMAKLAPSITTSVMFREALAFARSSRGRFREANDEKLFGRYSSLVRYLEGCEGYW